MAVLTDETEVVAGANQRHRHLNMAVADVEAISKHDYEVSGAISLERGRGSSWCTYSATRSPRKQG